MPTRRLFTIAACLSLCAFTLAAQTGTVTITASATIGPVLSGSDPLGQDGRNNVLVLHASETLSPTSSTSDSATYTLPAGSVVVSQSGIALTASSASTMAIQLTDTADILTVTYSVSPAIVNTFTAYLSPGSWGTGVLSHPAPFTPSNQALSPATTAGGAGSQSQYVDNGVTTALGVTGEIASGDNSVTSRYGDMDCFGLPNTTVCPNGSLWETGLGGVFFTDYRDPQEKAANSVTDIWNAPTGVNWNQPAYSASGAVSATLTLKIAGMADIGQSYEVTMNGIKVGTIHRNSSVNAFQEVVTWLFNVPVAVLNGNDHVMINTSGGDGFIIDYSNLSVVLAQ